ncbi:MAG TPA: ATP-dependent DNA helicase RecG [Bacteroidales bacterium]|nr:ATP-dependent DNA helicase RecG [Bacteroidales bacterium]
MNVNLLDNKVEFLKGVGPKKAAVLAKELNIIHLRDLLQHYPYRYIDKSRIHKVSEINNETVFYQLVGTVDGMQTHGGQRTTRITAWLTDETGRLELVWFKGLSWVKSRFVPGRKYVFFGKASLFKGRYNLVHPEVEDYNPDDFTLGESLQGVYSTTENMKSAGLGTRVIAKLIKTALMQLESVIPETLPKRLLISEKLMGRAEALLKIHLPADSEDIRKATYRLKFEEYFFFQLNILHSKKLREQHIKGHVFARVGQLFNTFYHDQLPFELTNAQKKVIREMRADLGSGIQMNRLLQGDVGSGKTVVALMLMLLAADNGYQAALMAPTEILAQQHYHTIRELLGAMPVKIALLTGSTRKAERTKLHDELRQGSLQILIGTHALIEDTVNFASLGLVIIDEQHRFGVAQRAKLYEKSQSPPHVLVMTATPIPRTLAMTQYGDLDVSIIDELPPGRKPIITRHFYPSHRLRLIGFLKKQIAEGRQIYIVYPLIKESEKLDLIALQEGYESLLRDFPEPDYRICVVHGKMSSEDKEFEMQRFVKGQAHIMVATTVIEVGVNVPNATVMVIEHADRFGLSQLHQLRGRVGRGADQSYCLLVTDFKLTSDGKARVQTMVETNDGFSIAEADLRLRGPGDTQGTQQSGLMQFRLGDLTKDEKIIRHVRTVAQEFLISDPQLIAPENKNTREEFERIYHKTFDWSLIG